MDRDRRRDGEDGLSDTGPVHETSFMTASDGTTSSDRSSDSAARRNMLQSSDRNPDDTDPNLTPRSSRSMPIPDHMKRGRRNSLPKSEQEHLQGGLDDRDGDTRENAPPSYNEAMGNPDTYVVHGDNAETGAGAEGATGVEGPLTPEEIAVVMRVQDDRESYLPADRRGSYGEAIEMDKDNDNVPKISKDERREDEPDHLHVSTARRDSIGIRHEFNGGSRFVEEGRPGPSRSEYVCTCCGPLNEPMTRLGRMMGRQSQTRLILFPCLIVFVIGLLLFVSLFPASFVYLDYHQIALKQSKMTNVVDRDTVYYGGCYILGPDTQFVRFQATSHNFVREMTVFTKDTISITIRYSAHYFIKPEEVGQLYSMFMHDYEEVFAKIFKSNLRTLAGMSLTVDNFRFNRTYVERQMHNMLRKKFGGDCCPACCTSRDCQHNDYCGTCKTSSCDQGYHIDVRYFNLLSVAIPDAVFERYLKSVLLKVDEERELFIQAHTLTVRETERITQEIKNYASEITNAGQSEANKVGLVSEAEREKVVQTSYAMAYKELYSRLNVTNEDLKLSLMYVQALREKEDNLYAGYGFAQNTLHMEP